MPTFTESDRDRLKVFLEVVQQINEASIVAQGQKLGFRVSGQEGAVQQDYDIFQNEAFRSLAMSVRLVYMTGEPANFGSICNLLFKAGEPDLREAVQSVRAMYNDLLNGNKVQFNLHGDLEGTVAGCRDILEAWLYGGTFHLDDLQKEQCLANSKSSASRSSSVCNLSYSR